MEWLHCHSSQPGVLTVGTHEVLVIGGSGANLSQEGVLEVVSSQFTRKPVNLSLTIPCYEIELTGLWVK